jgi:hypothetical protein
MKNKMILFIPIVLVSLTGCSNCEHEYEYLATEDAEKRTYLVGSDFDDTGLVVSKVCKKCHHSKELNYELENNEDLKAEQKISFNLPLVYPKDSYAVCKLYNSVTFKCILDLRLKKI